MRDRVCQRVSLRMIEGKLFSERWYATGRVRWYITWIKKKKILPINTAIASRGTRSSLGRGFPYRLAVYPLHALHRGDFVCSMVQLQPGLHEPNRICQRACHETWKMNARVFNPIGTCGADCDCLSSLQGLIFIRCLKSVSGGWPLENRSFNHPRNALLCPNLRPKNSLKIPEVFEHRKSTFGVPLRPKLQQLF